MAHLEKTLATKPTKLSLFSWTHAMEGESRLPQNVL